MEKNLEYLLALTLGVLHSLLVAYVNGVVPQPYMDEEFHLQQASHYCAGQFHKWNAKITTPPLLYLVSLPVCRLLPSLPLHTLRYVNSLLVPVCFLGLCQLQRRLSHLLANGDNNGGEEESEENEENLSERKLKKKEKKEKKRAEEEEQKEEEGRMMVNANSLMVLTMPVLFHSSLLYYTDLLSLTTVAWGFATEWESGAAVIFAMAMLTRQTNIAWAAAYCLLNLLLRDLEPSRPFTSTLRSICRHGAFVLLAAGFAGFIYWNDGRVVLGDADAHQPMFHAAQVLYFLLFTALSSSPLLIFNTIRRISDAGFSSLLGTKKTNRLVFNLVALCLSILAIYTTTYAHPYLLADNRHLTFYLWRRWFARHWVCKYLLAPVYVLSLQHFISAPSTSRKPKRGVVEKSSKHVKKVLKEKVLKRAATHLIVAKLRRAAWLVLLPEIRVRLVAAVVLVGAAVCVVPAGLVELRYFIVPYALWRLAATKKLKGGEEGGNGGGGKDEKGGGSLLDLLKRSVHEPESLSCALELVMNVGVNVVVLYLFLNKPFKWMHEPWKWQRFMW